MKNRIIVGIHRQFHSFIGNVSHFSFLNKLLGSFTRDILRYPSIRLARTDIQSSGREDIPHHEENLERNAKRVGKNHMQARKARKDFELIAAKDV